MIIIRNEQFRVFSKYSENAFYQNICNKLRAAGGSFSNDHDVTSDYEKIKEIACRAESYGMRSKGELDGFFQLVSQYGPDFDLSEKHKGIGEIFHSQRKDASEKLIDAEIFLEKITEHGNGLF